MGIRSETRKALVIATVCELLAMGCVLGGYALGQPVYKVNDHLLSYLGWFLHLPGALIAPMFRGGPMEVPGVVEAAVTFACWFLLWRWIFAGMASERCDRTRTQPGNNSGFYRPSRGLQCD